MIIENEEDMALFWNHLKLYFPKAWSFFVSTNASHLPSFQQKL